MKYLPFLDGKYSTAPGLNKADPHTPFAFDLDEQYDSFIRNKQDCRKENIHKYYLETNLYPGTLRAVNQALVTLLLKEHPTSFIAAHPLSLHNKRTGETLRWKKDWMHMEEGPYLSLFDALCSQVPEDIAICQLEEDKDWLAAIHLSAPNYWSPAEKIGRPFSAIHAAVPGMEKLNQHYFKMLVTAVQKGPFIRFAWGITTDIRLNHHPTPPPGTDPVLWRGRKMEDEGSLYVRVERQTLIGLPDVNAFVFTIRTYFYAIDELSDTEKKALQMAVAGMSQESLAYKGLSGITIP
jgi:hypothetical protein